MVLEVLLDVLIFNPIFIGLLPFTIISIAVFVPMFVRRRRIQKIENALPDMLTELTENLKAGTALESALKNIATHRKDLMGTELKAVLKDMKTQSFTSALESFAKRSESTKIHRVISIINIGIDMGASLVDVLSKISEELWSTYMMDVERETKTKGYALLTIFGAALLTPAIVGFALSFFTSTEMTGTDILIYDIGIFLCIVAACSTIMYGTIVGRLREILLGLPLCVFSAYTVYTLMITLAVKLFG